MRDLAYSKKADAGDTAGLQETREAENVNSGQVVNIQDFSSSKVVIIDNCEKIFKALQELGKNTRGNNSYNAPPAFEKLI